MLDLGTLLDLVAEPDEDVDDLPQRLREEMHVALALLGRRERDVDPLPLPASLSSRPPRRPALRFDRFLERALYLVRELAHRSALVRRDLAETLRA